MSRIHYHFLPPDLPVDFTPPLTAMEIIVNQVDGEKLTVLYSERFLPGEIRTELCLVCGLWCGLVCHRPKSREHVLFDSEQGTIRVHDQARLCFMLWCVDGCVDVC